MVQWFLTPDNVGAELLPEVAAAVDAAVAGREVELSRHSFGCRVLQALLKVLHRAGRRRAALHSQSLLPGAGFCGDISLASHAFHACSSCPALQVLGPEARVLLALKLSGHASKLATDLHANHVLRVCLETVTPSDPIRPLIEVREAVVQLRAGRVLRMSWLS